MVRIIAFDGQKLARDFVIQALQEAGHEVLTLNPPGVFEALNAIYEFKPDLVITDIVLPTCNAESLVRAIQEDRNLQHLKLMVLSTNIDNNLMHRLSNRGVNAFVTKGREMRDLKQRVRALFTEAKLG
jgi:DNA-binding response OmpR family regulator